MTETVEKEKTVKQIYRDEAMLVAIDFQQRLLPAMEKADKLQETMVKLAKGLAVLGIPHIVTQQYTKGLGQTVAEIATAIGPFTPIDKMTFSACGDEAFLTALRKLTEEGRKTVILTGIETHICVEQTALDLLKMGYTVALVSDCVASRDKKNTKISIKRLRDAGAVIVSYESVLYALLGSAKAPEFKAISAIVK